MGRQGLRITRSSPQSLTYVSTIAQWVRLVAWQESPSYGRPWADGLLVGPLEKPWQQRKVTRCTSLCYRFPRRQTIVSGPGEQLQRDLVDCSEYREANNGTRYLFCCIDMFSKYAWAQPLTSKSCTETVGARLTILDCMQDGPSLAVQSDKVTIFL